MKHYVMTTSHFGPDYPPEANRRRIEMLRGVTARSLRGQEGDWTWIVFAHPDDPFRVERLDAFASAGRRVVPVADVTEAEAAIDWSGEVLTTRIDDDDAFARDAFRRLYTIARSGLARSVLLFPHGYRVNGSMVTSVRSQKNAYTSLWAPRGDRLHIRMRQHRHVAELAPIRVVDNRPAFLWVRHPDTNTAFRSARGPLGDSVRSLFDVDWPLIERSGGAWPGPVPGRSGI